MTIMIYKEADLDNIFVRAQRPDGKWDSISLSELSDKQFVEWAEEKFKVEIRDHETAKGIPWTPQQKVHFLNDMAKRAGKPVVVMAKARIKNEQQR